jgi:TRAP-type mannitol/chloroaromatic compound transport system permease small subunit
MQGELRWVTRLVRFSEDFCEQLGRVVRWLVLAIVLIGSLNAVARYLGRFVGFNLSSNLWLELQWYLFSLMFLLGAAYTLHHDEHVRVDVFIQRLSPRGRAWVNLAGTLLFLIPFCILMIWTSWFPVRNSWKILEMSPDPGGLPRYPIKTAIPVAFLLVLAVGCAQAVRLVRELRRRPPPGGGTAA